MESVFAAQNGSVFRLCHFESRGGPAFPKDDMDVSACQILILDRTSTWRDN